MISVFKLHTMSQCEGAPADDYWLRIERGAEVHTVSYSVDGQNFVHPFFVKATEYELNRPVQTFRVTFTRETTSE